MTGICDVCNGSARDQRSGVFGYHSPSPPPTPCREVLKWVQSLDLSLSLRNARRDCANGFMVAEILSRYFPQDANMHAFVNGTSTAVRKDNWALVQKACRRNEFELPKDVVTACQAERSGAANTMLEVLYEHLTQKQIRRPEELLSDLAKAPQGEDAASESDVREPDFAGAEGAAAISQNARPPADLKFGSIKQRSLDDAVSLRQKLAAQ